MELIVLRLYTIAIGITKLVQALGNLSHNTNDISMKTLG